MTERFIGVDRSGDFTHPTDHLYFVATRFSRRGELRRVIRLSREKIEELKRRVADYEEKLSAIMMFIAIDRIFHPGYSIQVDKDYEGRRLKKVRGYLKRLFGVVNYGRAFSADPPLEFLPKEYSSLIRHADKKANLARHKEIKPDESDPNIEELLKITEEARRKGLV